MSRDTLPEAGTPTSERLLQGDRLCAKCGFNLCGQVVFRDETYEMLVVRCPECGTLASLQEYPILSPVLRRLGFALVGLWMLILLAVMGAMCGAQLGWSFAMSEDISRPIGRAFAEDQTRWFEALPEAERGLFGYTTQQLEQGMISLPDWSDQLDRRQVIRDAGGRWSLIEWRRFAPFITLLFLWVPVGAFWAVALPHASRVRLFLVLLIPPVIAASVVVANYNTEPTGWQAQWWFTPYKIGEHTARPVSALVVIGLSTTVMVLASWFGRPIARLGVKILLPPRLRGTCAFLWFADGLQAPSTRPKR